jgi:hypothetical protein
LVFSLTEQAVTEKLAWGSVVEAKTGGNSPIVGLWHKAQELSRSFVCFEISFVKLEANNAAHYYTRICPLYVTG